MMVMSLSAEQARRQSCRKQPPWLRRPLLAGLGRCGLAAAEGEVAMAGGKAVEVVRTRLTAEAGERFKARYGDG
jgi:hypothetical protein